VPPRQKIYVVKHNAIYVQLEPLQFFQSNISQPCAIKGIVVALLND